MFLLYLWYLGDPMFTFRVSKSSSKATYGGRKCLVYFPQPFGAAADTHQCWERVSKGSNVSVRVPVDRVNDDLWIWMFGADEMETKQSASTRIGFCRFENTYRIKKGDELACNFNHQVPYTHT